MKWTAVVGGVHLHRRDTYSKKTLKHWQNECLPNTFNLWRRTSRFRRRQTPLRRTSAGRNEKTKFPLQRRFSDWPPAPLHSCHVWLLYSCWLPSAAASAGSLNSWPVLTVSPAQREEQLSPERSHTGSFLSEACFAIEGLFSSSALIPLVVHPRPR